ncbi:MAG: LolA family protein [Desulfomonilaceae bacterium]
MRKFKNEKHVISNSLWLSVALWAVICGAPTLCLPQSSGLSLNDVVARMRNVYSKQCCFKASFDQLTVNVSMDMRDKFQGTMYVRRPSSIALDVETPEKQKVVVQGKSYAVYFPQDGSVVRGDVPPEMNVEQFFGFFADIAGIDRRFDMNFPEKAVDTMENLIFLELTDKTTEQPTYRILLGVDAKAFTVRRAVIYDALGNYNRFDLSNVTFLSSLPDSRFSINVPGSHGNLEKQPKESSSKD